MKGKILVIHKNTPGPIEIHVLRELQKEAEEIKEETLLISEFSNRIVDILAEYQGFNVIFSRYIEPEIMTILKNYPAENPQILALFRFNICECTMENNSLKMRVLQKIPNNY